ncbi:MAG: type II secretion system protein [Candidatus Paceibacterota bacterium]
MRPRSINKQAEGLTLVETLVAIGLLTTLVFAVFGAVSSGFQASAHARDQVVAGLLAQEAIETIRNARDQNLVARTAWLDGLGECETANGCKVDVHAASMVSSCGTGGCEALKYDDSTGRYGYDAGWGASRYTREVMISEDTPGEATITASVSCGGSRTVVIEETLYDLRAGEE